jgi:S1-C subfamily serine protease
MVLFLLCNMSHGKENVIMATPINRNVVISTDKGRGSGIIISKNVILTVFHNLHLGSDIKVNGKVAKVLKVDAKNDLMLLVIKTPNIPDVVLAETITQDEEIICYGNPMSHTGMVLRGRVIDIDGNKLYTDAHVFFGSSGGGAYNLKGELVGIVDAIEGQKKSGYPYGVIINAETIYNFLKEK